MGEKEKKIDEWMFVMLERSKSKVAPTESSEIKTPEALAERIVADILYRNNRGDVRLEEMNLAISALLREREIELIKAIGIRSSKRDFEAAELEKEYDDLDKRLSESESKLKEYEGKSFNNSECVLICNGMDMYRELLKKEVKRLRGSPHSDKEVLADIESINKIERMCNERLYPDNPNDGSD